MIRRIIIVLLLGWGSAAMAQTGAAEPILRVDLESDSAIPGQPISLRVTVLVPTYMPDPPEWPSFELPNLLVRLPERSTNPTSESIDGDTWSGISRHYRLSPMIPGQFTLPPQEILITYADPDGNAPIQATLKTEQVSFSGTVPEGAEGLDPFLAAKDLDLKLDIEGDTEGLTPGASVKLTVEAKIEGTSPMFLPQLLPPFQIEGVAIYRDEPSIAETGNRGEISGTRRESATLIAEGGGSGQVPVITLDWYDLDGKSVETARTSPVDIAVIGPPAATQTEPRDWRAIAIAASVILLAAAAITFVGRAAFSLLTRRYNAARRARLASEGFAFRQVKNAVRHQDYHALHPALEAWRARLPASSDPLSDSDVQTALTDLGRTRYGRASGDKRGEIAAWHALAAALPKLRRSAESATTRQMLPPLNPGA